MDLRISKRAKDLTGGRFGRLIAIKPVEKNKHSAIVWECRCDCGGTVNIIGSNLLNGNSKSCGCFRRDASTTHGMSKANTYRIWRNMLQRCNNPNDSDFKDYGARGIKVCEEWNDPNVFVKDMGERPKDRTLDRIDNDKGYSPDNCRWATKSQQRLNSRPISYGKRKQFYFMAWRKFRSEQYLSNNQHEFARQWGLSACEISRCLGDKIRQHKGWIFKRVEGHRNA